MLFDALTIAVFLLFAFAAVVLLVAAVGKLSEAKKEMDRARHLSAVAESELRQVIAMRGGIQIIDALEYEAETATHPGNLALH